MTLSQLTEIVQKMAVNGTLKSTNIQLTKGIIEGYLRTAYGAVIQSILDKKNKMDDKDASYLIAGAIETKLVKLEKIGKKSSVNISQYKPMRIDDGMDIVAFEQPPKSESCFSGGVMQPITYVSPFEVRFYLGADCNDMFFYTRTTTGVDIYNLPDCLKELNVSFVSGNGNVDIPEDVALNMLKIAFPDVFGVKKFGKEKIDDNSNDIVHQIKQQLVASA